MKMIEAWSAILALNQPVFRTDDVSQCLRVTRMNASKILSRLEDAEHIFHVNRGLWAVKGKATLWDLAKYATIPFPNYVSLQSALYHHGIISQISAVLYVVSPARTRVFRTPLGSISIHHVRPAFFCGYRRISREGPLMALKEKALIDFFYFHPAKSSLFRALPEIELPENFSIPRAKKFISLIGSKRRRSMVTGLFNSLLSGHM